jgi:hypothetical protein
VNAKIAKTGYIENADPKYTTIALVSKIPVRSMTYHSGNNSPVIINSKDNYTNVTISGINDENVFEELKKCISKNVDGANKEELLSSVNYLETAKGSNGYTKAFKSFVQIAKDGMTIIGPFIPLLVSYIK